jgi:hypothetical protein
MKHTFDVLVLLPKGAPPQAPTYAAGSTTTRIVFVCQEYTDEYVQRYVQPDHTITQFVPPLDEWPDTIKTKILTLNNRGRSAPFASTPAQAALLRKMVMVANRGELAILPDDNNVPWICAAKIVEGNLRMSRLAPITDKDVYGR